MLLAMGEVAGMAGDIGCAAGAGVVVVVVWAYALPIAQQSASIEPAKGLENRFMVLSSSQK